MILENLRSECSEEIKKVKEKFLKKQGEKLADPNDGQKQCWKMLDGFLNKCKIPRTPPPLLVVYL